MLKNKRILLIIGGGIAAYKSLDLIRRLQDQGARVRAILTAGGAEFITPLSVSSLTGEKTFQDLFSLTDETEMGHIRLSREADLILIAPATADLMAKMVAGLAGDLATTALLATSAPVMVCPAMNTAMWTHKATQRNLAQLQEDGVHVVAPGAGDLACGEVGEGRLAEVPDIVAAVQTFFEAISGPLAGKKAVVTAGPTYEAIDPVRYIANRSSGKQGYEIAGALARLGAETILVSGPTALETPDGVIRTDIESARDMLTACEAALPADIAVCVAAVADWRVADTGDQKIKKNGRGTPDLSLVENPDILKTLASRSNDRPQLVVGFAAETEDVLQHAAAKLARKGCDWIVANNVSAGTGVMGGNHNWVHVLNGKTIEEWEHASKREVADRLAAKISEHLALPH